tara:strand:- start:45 stop:323 length:279 start_codon:yes stop_codon:yes gene_type:complete
MVPMNESAVPSADGDEEPELNLVVSVFFLSMVGAGVLIALMCHYYGGTCESTVGMATIVAPPEEGPDHAEESSPKAGVSREEDKTHACELEL